MAINNSGTIAFLSYSNVGQFPETSALETISGGVVTTIADTAGPTFASLGSFVIDDAGVVTFSATLKDGTAGVFVAVPGGQPTEVNDPEDNFENVISIDQADGDVLLAGGDSLAIENGGVITQIVNGSSLGIFAIAKHGDQQQRRRGLCGSYWV